MINLASKGNWYPLRLVDANKLSISHRAVEALVPSQEMQNELAVLAGYSTKCQLLHEISVFVDAMREALI